MARLTKKLTRKIRAPTSTLRHVSAKKSPIKNQTLFMQFATRVQDRLEKFLHNLFRSTFKIEIGLLGHLPELIQSASPGAFEGKHLN
jgi:polynucleotide 5'-kinase involved in rRNA processing